MDHRRGEARADAHELRADSQAIVVGAGTALADRPRLTVRDVDAAPVARQPLRVLLDARGRVAADGPLFDPALAPTLVVTTDGRRRRRAVDAWLRRRGQGRRRRAGPRAAAASTSPPRSRCSAREGVLQALVEGGGRAARLAASTADSPTGSSPTSRRSLLGPDGRRRGFDFAGPAHASPTRPAGGLRRRRPRRRPTSASRRSSPPRGERRGASDVHRHRRGAGRGAGRRPERGRRPDRDRRARRVLDDAELGASIAVNGCCLTVVELGDGLLGRRRGRRDARPHEPRRARAGDPVNLERPVRLADRLGGHLVQGHVDGDRRPCAHRDAASPTAPTRIGLRRARRRVALRRHKGSITVDGISLTVAARRRRRRSTSR